jgi:hypothetical protein
MNKLSILTDAEIITYDGAEFTASCVFTETASPD